MSSVISTIFAVVVLGGVAAFYFLMYGRMKKGGVSIFGAGGAAQAQNKIADLYTRLGYRSVVETNEAQMNEQVRKGQAVETHMIRQMPGAEIHYRSATTHGGTGTELSNSWSMPVSGQIVAGIHIAEKSVADATKRVAVDMLTSRRTEWTPAYDQQFPSGDPELDKRFRFYGTDSRQVQSILADTSLRQLLLDIPYVDVSVTSGAVVFNDPMQKAMRTAMGGTFGMMNMFTESGLKTQEDLHNNIAQLMKNLAAKTTLGR
jgi:hypothetical protein